MVISRKLLLEGADPVVTSELTRLEFASAVTAAHRDHRLSDPTGVLARFDWDCRDEGAFTFLRMNTRTIMPAARQLVTTHRLRSPDALHLATALQDAIPLAGGEQVAMVTRDQRQATAAREHGLTVL
ncbi:hypothetical protein DFQ14_103299 [Halopolyspora algeriensis]|uniref:PIN domain-containing protein n=1 Tax=Halopolyspora algeriensis TaxID=1500506 RepID=A0A368VX60_9ACTN|nr:type II toxin-antitoxin system VapC family toxin [Halopolyspora algeriensis]RCW45328.1 hypothetical protein DFQ14_103299 [Halopolyspora algeriensis]TQM47368.1 hypothetical protein FHU43_3353 [Halopolyspora algeriensis]